MNVIELRQLAVFMNAGSYVINPKSSVPVLICRRSMARTVPFWIGSSYFLPVRLSVIERVSGIGHYSIHRSALGFRLWAFSPDQANADRFQIRPKVQSRKPKA